MTAVAMMENTNGSKDNGESRMALLYYSDVGGTARGFTNINSNRNISISH